MTLFTTYLPFIFTAASASALLSAIYYVLLGRNETLNNDRKFPRQIAFILLVFVVLWMLILFLPIDARFRAEMSTILGVIFSALVALSSTTMLSNVMAGIVLRITKPFAIGDFIRIDGYFGRVSERGLFDTELQTEERAFVSIPNAYLIKNPVSAIHASGTIVSVQLSLGYDVHHQHIEPLLLAAAEKAKLDKPFMHILALGDFSVTYRISGLLEETKHYVSVKSRLFACVLDELHAHNIEILSPNYMAQRPSDPAVKVIPSPITCNEKAVSNAHQAETVIFDKAERAEHVEHLKQQLSDEITALKAQKNTENIDKDLLMNQIDSKTMLLEQLEQLSND